MIHSRSFRGGESELTNSRRRATGEQISRLRGERGKTMRREIGGLPGGRVERRVEGQGFEVRRLLYKLADVHPLSSLLICRYRLKRWPQHPECQVATWRCLILTALSSLVPAITLTSRTTCHLTHSIDTSCRFLAIWHAPMG